MDIEPPHPNGTGNHDRPPARRAHPPWEFLVLLLFVAILAIGIIVGWTLYGSKSPERLQPADAASIAATCTTAQNALKQLPNAFPKTGADRVERIRRENTILRQMVGAIDAVAVHGSTPAAAVKGWTGDWTRVIEARDRYATELESVKGTKKTVKFVLPAAKDSLKPVTENMDDFVRENHPHLDACFTQALQLEVYEGQRIYQKVTS